MNDILLITDIYILFPLTWLSLFAVKFYLFSTWNVMFKNLFIILEEPSWNIKTERESSMMLLNSGQLWVLIC